MYNLISGATRPNRFEQDQNSKQYHIDYARYCIDGGYNSLHDEWVSQTQLNTLFYFDNQWVVNEDLEQFLKDDSNQTRNRVKVQKNYVLPTVNQYIGNSIAMNLTVRAKPVSPRARYRRESKLEELLLLTDLSLSANQSIKDEIISQFGIGENRKETQTIFSNLWQDSYVKTINMLCENVSERNEFKSKQPLIAFQIALSGLGVMRYFVHNGEMNFGVTESLDFFFDRTAVEPDLTDAEFQGHVEWMLPSQILERYPAAKEYAKSLEEVATNNTISSNTTVWVRNGKIPVYFPHWQDCEEQKWGYVLDEFGYPYLARIDYIEPRAKEARYTEKDLIPEKDLNETQKKILGGSNVTKKYVDLIRFAAIIPREVLSSAKNNQDNKDILLDYGIMPYQDTEYYTYYNCKFPYKCSTWFYSRGFIFSPISALINPQRMINRMESVKENMVNCSLPGIPVYDKSAVDDQDGEDEMMRKWYQGKAVGIDARGTGINNAISRVGSSLDANSVQAYDMFGESYRVAMDRIVGVNESLRGESQGSEQLVGVTALQIQRASLIQEPFYNAIERIYVQCYQAIANVGKRIYADNQRELAIMVGDDNMEVVTITKDMNLEDFRIFMERQPDIAQQRTAADAAATQLLTAGLIDPNTFADLYGRSTMLDIAEAIRKSANNRNVAAMQQQKQQIQMEEQAQLASQAATEQNLMAQIDQRNTELANNAADRENKKEMKMIDATAKMATANAPRPPLQ